VSHCVRNWGTKIHCYSGYADQMSAKDHCRRSLNCELCTQLQAKVVVRGSPCPVPTHTAFFLGAFAKLRQATISFVICLSVCWNNSAPTGRVFMKFDIWVFFENLSKKFNLH
jgi:hypothetical protein